MRLLSIELNGFRGFSQKYEFDLNAEAIIIVGANGHGKTSLFDGILWALSGKVPRPHCDDSHLISLYSDSGQARVALRLRDDQTGTTYTIIRSSDGKEKQITFESNGDKLKGPSAEGKLIDLIWPDAAAASEPLEALASVLTRSIYLQQDLVRQFIEAASEQERFAAVSELVGAGRVTELQANLERSKKNWSTITNQRQEELNPLRDRLALLRNRLSEITASSSGAPLSISFEEWSQWWQDVAGLGCSINKVEQSAREAPMEIDHAIKQLEALRRATERRLQNLRTTINEIATFADRQIPEITPLRESLAGLQRQLQDLRSDISQEQARLADERNQQAALKEKSEQLRILATLALKNLEDHCPVCAQPYDKVATRSRLEIMAKGDFDKTNMEPELVNKLAELLDAAAAKEKEIAAIEMALRAGERVIDELNMSRQTINKLLTEIVGEISPNQDQESLAKKTAAEAEGLLNRVVELQKSGESLALRLIQVFAMASINELRHEIETLELEVNEQDKAILARNKTGDLAQHVIEALRDASSAVVEHRLQEISPLLQNIWARIDPHPAFRAVHFLSQIFRGRGQLSTIVRDPIEDKSCEYPTTVLSSSQANALAVSVFLALNIGIPRPPLPVAILDDPLQSLDDINLLGLVDLFRRIKERRQLIISTHDARFGNLLARKLRPRTEKDRTLVIEMKNWSRQGPKFEIREVKKDPVALRLINLKAG